MVVLCVWGGLASGWGGARRLSEHDPVAGLLSESLAALWQPAPADVITVCVPYGPSCLVQTAWSSAWTSAGPLLGVPGQPRPQTPPPPPPRAKPPPPPSPNVRLRLGGGGVRQWVIWRAQNERRCGGGAARVDDGRVPGGAGGAGAGRARGLPRRPRRVHVPARCVARPSHAAPTARHRSALTGRAMRGPPVAAAATCQGPRCHDRRCTRA